jgi:hypothetical protein
MSQSYAPHYHSLLKKNKHPFLCIPSMKRLFICKEEEEGKNPFLDLPSELIDTFLTLNNAKPCDYFASLVKLYVVNRDSYTRFDLLRKVEVLHMIKKYDIGALLRNRDEYIMCGVWEKISCLALCHTSYKVIIDEYFDRLPEYEKKFVAMALKRVKECVHPSQYKESNVNVYHLIKNHHKLPSALQRLLAYHCSVISTLDCKKRTTIGRVSHFTSLCNIYVYDDRERDDNDAKYLVRLCGGEEDVQIDVRYLTPLSLPFNYHNNEMVYAVEYVPDSLARSRHFMLNPLLGREGRLSPALDIEPLLKRIRMSELFCACLLKCRHALIPVKQPRKLRGMLKNGGI